MRLVQGWAEDWTTFSTEIEWFCSRKPLAFSLDPTFPRTVISRRPQKTFTKNKNKSFVWICQSQRQMLIMARERKNWGWYKKRDTRNFRRLRIVSRPSSLPDRPSSGKPHQEEQRWEQNCLTMLNPQQAFLSALHQNYQNSQIAARNMLPSHHPISVEVSCCQATTCSSGSLQWHTFVKCMAYNVVFNPFSLRVGPWHY